MHLAGARSGLPSGIGQLRARDSRSNGVITGERARDTAVVIRGVWDTVITVYTALILVVLT